MFQATAVNYGLASQIAYGEVTVDDSEISEDLKQLVECFKKYIGSENAGMCYAAEDGNIEMVNVFIERGASDWNEGLEAAAKGGHMDIVELFIERGAEDLDWGLEAAAERGHEELCRFFLDEGANENWGLRGAAFGGHKNLVDLFIEVGADSWDWGYLSASERGDKELMEFFNKKMIKID